MIKIICFMKNKFGLTKFCSVWQNLKFCQSLEYFDSTGDGTYRNILHKNSIIMTEYATE